MCSFDKRCCWTVAVFFLFLLLSSSSPPLLLLSSSSPPLVLSFFFSPLHVFRTSVTTGPKSFRITAHAHSLARCITDWLRQHKMYSPFVNGSILPCVVCRMVAKRQTASMHAKQARLGGGSRLARQRKRTKQLCPSSMEPGCSTRVRVEAS